MLLSENVILYGFIEDYIKLVDALDGLDIKASVLGVPAQITGFENFEFTVFANAIGALYKRNKATEKINLLEVDQSTGKGGNSGMGSLLMTGGIFAVAAAVLIAGATLVINLRKSSIEKDIDKTNDKIAVCNEKIAQNQILHNKMKIMQDYSNYVTSANAALETLPVVSSEMFDDITGSKAGQHSHQQCCPDVHAGKQAHDAHRAAGAKAAVYGQVGYIQNTVGQVHANGHDAPDEALRTGTGQGTGQVGKSCKNIQNVFLL